MWRPSLGFCPIITFLPANGITMKPERTARERQCFQLYFFRKRGQSQIIWPGICQFSLFVEFRTFCYQTELWTFIRSSNEQNFSSLMLFKYFFNEFCVSLNFWSAWFDLIKYDLWSRFTISRRGRFPLNFIFPKLYLLLEKHFFNRNYNF